MSCKARFTVSQSKISTGKLFQMSGAADENERLVISVVRQRTVSDASAAECVWQDSLQLQKSKQPMGYEAQLTAQLYKHFLQRPINH